MLVKPAYTCLVAQVVRAPVQCERHNLAVLLPAYLSVHLPMTVCLGVSVLCSFYLFCRPVLPDYLVAQVVRVPDPIGDTFIFSKYVGLYPASTLFPQKNIRTHFQMLYLDLKKSPKMYRNDSLKGPKNYS